MQPVVENLTKLYRAPQGDVVAVARVSFRTNEMADRIFVMNGHPGRIVGELDVLFGRPRTDVVREQAGLAALRRTIWDMVRGEAAKMLTGAA